MLKHLRILAVGLLTVMIFSGFVEISGGLSDKIPSSSSGNKKKSKKRARRLVQKKLAEGKKDMEEDKYGVQFIKQRNEIILKRFNLTNLKSY